MQLWRLLAGTTVAASALGMAGVASAAPGDKIAGRYICVFKDGAVAKGNVRAEANRAASNAGGRADHFYEHALRGFAASMSAQAAQNLQARDSKIKFCEQDQEMGLVQDALDFRVLGKPTGGGTTPPAQEIPWGIGRVNGGTGDYAGSTAWVIDTGVDLTHRDLNVDTARSVNFIARETSPNDLNGHGTHVAGTIGAINDAFGVVGVSPNVKVVAVRVLDRRGSGTNSGVIAGVNHVASKGGSGDVANMSLGGGVSQALDDAVVGATAGGVRFVLAAGNESDSATNHSPARANGPNVYTVSSFAVGDKWSSFSNFGNPPIDYAAPGSGIKSTWKDGGYNTISGTSMAAPHIAGILIAGPIRSDSNVNGDPDSNPDPIGER